MTMLLRRPSADTAVIVGTALAGLRAIYRPGYKLAKAGVMLLRIPVKSTINSNRNPATCSSGNLATVPVQTLPSTASWTAPLIVA